MLSWGYILYTVFLCLVTYVVVMAGILLLVVIANGHATWRNVLLDIATIILGLRIRHITLKRIRYWESQE